MRKIIPILVLTILISSSLLSFQIGFNLKETSALTLEVSISPTDAKLAYGQHQIFTAIILNGYPLYMARWYSNDTYIGSGIQIDFSFPYPCAYTILRVEVTDSRGNIGSTANIVYDPISFTTTIEAGSMTLPVASLIFKDVATGYYRNGTTGAIDYSSADFGNCLAYAISHLTSGRTTREVIAVRGVYIISGGITIDDEDFIFLDFTSGELYLADNVNSNMFQIVDSHDVTIYGGVFDANGEHQTGGHGFYISGCYNIELRNMEVRIAADHNIVFYESARCLVDGVNSHSAVKDGIAIADDSGYIIVSNSKFNYNEAYGMIVLQGSYNIVSDCVFYDNGYYGIKLCQFSNFNLFDSIIIDTCTLPQATGIMLEALDADHIGGNAYNRFSNIQINDIGDRGIWIRSNASFLNYNNDFTNINIRRARTTGVDISTYSWNNTLTNINVWDCGESGGVGYRTAVSDAGNWDFLSNIRTFDTRATKLMENGIVISGDYNVLANSICLDAILYDGSIRNIKVTGTNYHIVNCWNGTGLEDSWISALP